MNPDNKNNTHIEKKFPMTTQNMLQKMPRLLIE